MNKCHPFQTRLPQTSLSLLLPLGAPTLLGNRDACFNPDYQAEAHQLCPFSARNTYSSNTAINADKHMKCMNKAQRENEVVIVFQLLSEKSGGLDSFQIEGRFSIGNTQCCFSERKARRSDSKRERERRLWGGGG